MFDIAIQVENISKKYSIGSKSSGSLREALVFGWNGILGKEKVEKNEFWALKDISFEVKQGEVLGIIGKNGAGKSTLLKVLSRITEPTSGRIEINGRVSSLLEVGTGFHPELTGRENIFLNGTILGMSRKEVKFKFDEIVDFSGVEKFIDTPVKHYSSGMYVRLAFAVAAHLEPEILIIDEVLAVGDAEFQSKCLGKMQDVSRKDGRTIIFVSHNMMAISSICNRLISIKNGNIIYYGGIQLGIEQYLSSNIKNGVIDLINKDVHIGPCRFSKFTKITLCNSAEIIESDFKIGENLIIKFEFILNERISDLEIGFSITNMMGITYSTFIGEWEGLKTDYIKGNHIIVCNIKSINCFPGTYSISPWIKRKMEYVDDQIERAMIFNVLWKDITGFLPNFEKYPNMGIYQKCEWYFEK